MLRLEGVEEKVERINRYTNLADTIDSFAKEQSHTAPA